MTVLVVEDDDGTCDVLRQVLEEAGYDVMAVTTTDAALTYLREAPGCIVLLDYLLYLQNGAALLRAVACESALRRHHYVLVTAMDLGHIPEEDRQLAEALCADIVRKPFEIDMLLHVVASAGAHPWRVR